MKKYEALDIETIWDDGVAKPICIAITNGNKIHFKIIKTHEIDDCEILMFLLKKCSSKKIYYVHNLTFEIFVFLRYMVKKQIKFKIVSADKNVYSAEIKWGKKKIKFRCSYKLTMLSLKKLAKLAEIREKTSFPYSILTKEMMERVKITEEMFNSKKEYEEFKDINGEEIITSKILEDYCKNDAIITKKSIEKYWCIIEKGGLKNNNKILTAAKLSVENYFQSNFVIKKKIPLKYDRILRPYYFGGRTEVFGNPRKGDLVLHFDWKGMYAQCMSEKVLGGEIIQSDAIKDISIPGFYWIKFKQNLDIPVLPVKKEKLLFVNGVFEGWYWFEEILLAIDEGVEILNVSKMITGQHYDHFIKNFVEINNKIREISPLHKQIGKNNNNTFYGRLGMNPERMEEEIIDSVEKENYEKVVENNGIFLGYKKKEKSISNITIAAAITSKARIKLYKGMRSVVKEGGRILYTDTDSIIAAFKKEKRNEILNKQIGEVCFDSSKNDTLIADAVFAMPKTYAIRYENGQEIVKIKGFNSKPNFKNFKEKFYKKESIVTNNIIWNKKDFTIVKEIQEKKTNLYSLDKRIWKNDLKDTKPLNLLR